MHQYRVFVIVYFNLYQIVFYYRKFNSGMKISSSEVIIAVLTLPTVASHFKTITSYSLYNNINWNKLRDYKQVNFQQNSPLLLSN